MLTMNLQLFAHKKGTGSSHNGRDSESKRLGAKRADGQFVLAATSVPSARHPHSPGTNCGIGGDDTLFALVDRRCPFRAHGQEEDPLQRVSGCAVIFLRRFRTSLEKGAFFFVLDSTFHRLKKHKKEQKKTQKSGAFSPCFA